MSKENQLGESKSQNLVITGLSPVFIGSGEKYSQLDYFSQENNIYILDFDQLLAKISLEVIDDLTNDIQQNFENNIWKGDVQEFLSKYEINWEDSVARKYNLIGKIGRNEINQFIKTGENIYIPGSSIKGAIRTALLFKILKDHPEKKNAVTGSVLHNFKDRDIIRLIQTDGSNDLLRALQISDSNINEDPLIKIVETRVYHLRDKESKIPIYYEILDKGFSYRSSIKINSKLVDANVLVSQYFDLTQGKIIGAVNAFSKEIIAYELQEFMEQKDPNLSEMINFYQDLTSELEGLENNECILRLGQGSSVFGITLFLNFKDNNSIVFKYKGLETFHFNIPDRDNRKFGIARQGQFTIIPDRDSPHKPLLNESWLCNIVAVRRNTKYVNLLEKTSKLYDFESQRGNSYLFPLTRKFVVSENNRFTAPLGWVKLRWE